MYKIRPQPTRYIIIQSIWIDTKYTGHPEYKMVKVPCDIPDEQIKIEATHRLLSHHPAIAVSVNLSTPAITTSEEEEMFPPLEED
jgi:hypothetical protein